MEAKTMETITPVQKLLYSMFTENTGKALCDSGDAYGRNYERNSKLTIKDLINRDSVHAEIYGDVKTSKDVIVTIDCFKYLESQGFELDAICNKFNKINSKAKDSDFERMYGTCLKAGEYLENLGFEFKEPWNTYNDSNQILSQVLQGCYCELNGVWYVLIQVHGGCDVRGGYTDTKMFKLTNSEYKGYLSIPDVYGVILTGKNQVQVDNMYNGYSLTDENGKDVKLSKKSKVELSLMNY